MSSIEQKASAVSPSRAPNLIFGATAPLNLCSLKGLLKHLAAGRGQVQPRRIMGKYFVRVWVIMKRAWSEDRY